MLRCAAMDCVVYILRNPNGKIYIGQTENVQRRVEQHNDGDSQWTKKKGPWSLIWTSNPLPRSTARALELKLKRQKGGDGLKKIMHECGTAVNPAAAGS